MCLAVYLEDQIWKYQHNGLAEHNYISFNYKIILLLIQMELHGFTSQIPP